MNKQMKQLNNKQLNNKLKVKDITWRLKNQCKLNRNNRPLKPIGCGMVRSDKNNLNKKLKTLVNRNFAKYTEDQLDKQIKKIKNQISNRKEKIKKKSFQSELKF